MNPYKSLHDLRKITNNALDVLADNYKDRKRIATASTLNDMVDAILDSADIATYVNIAPHYSKVLLAARKAKQQLISDIELLEANSLGITKIQRLYEKAFQDKLLSLPSYESKNSIQNLLTKMDMTFRLCSKREILCGTFRKYEYPLSYMYMENVCYRNLQAITYGTAKKAMVVWANKEQEPYDVSNGATIHEVIMIKPAPVSTYGRKSVTKYLNGGFFQPLHGYIYKCDYFCIFDADRETVIARGENRLINKVFKAVTR